MNTRQEVARVWIAEIRRRLQENDFGDVEDDDLDQEPELIEIRRRQRQKRVPEAPPLERPWQERRKDVY